MEQRKGLTPIIAVVLLLMMTVAAAGLAYQFVIGTQSDVQDKVKNQLDTQLGAADLKWDVDRGTDATAGATTGALTLTLRNTGKGALAANSITVYQDGVLRTPVTQAAFAAGTTTPLTATGMNFPGVGNSTTIRMVHTSGVSVVYTCTNNGGAAEDTC